MKSFLIACGVAIIIAIGAGVILNIVEQPPGHAYMTSNVRL